MPVCLEDFVLTGQLLHSAVNFYLFFSKGHLIITFFALQHVIFCTNNPLIKNPLHNPQYTITTKTFKEIPRAI